MSGGCLEAWHFRWTAVLVHRMHSAISHVSRCPPDVILRRSFTRPSTALAVIEGLGTRLVTQCGQWSGNETGIRCCIVTQCGQWSGNETGIRCCIVTQCGQWSGNETGMRCCIVTQCGQWSGNATPMIPSLLTWQANTVWTTQISKMFQLLVGVPGQPGLTTINLHCSTTSCTVVTCATKIEELLETNRSLDHHSDQKSTT